MSPAGKSVSVERMGGWVRCTVKEPFLEGEVIRWTQDILEKKHPAREELVRVGELEVTAQVQSEDEKGWVFLTVITSSVTIDLTKPPRLHAPKKGAVIRRHRGTIFKGRPQRSRAAWDQNARESVAEKALTAGGLAMSYNRMSRQGEAGQ